MTQIADNFHVSLYLKPCYLLLYLSKGSIIKNFFTFFIKAFNKEGCSQIDSFFS